MWTFARLLARNRRAILLFALLVLLPVTILGVLITGAVRAERVRFEHEKTTRRAQIVRLAEADLINWLFAAHSNAALSKALLRFRIERDRIVFPDFNLSLPNTPSPRQRPFDPPPQEKSPTIQSITDQYYPRIQVFLRDSSSGGHSGAQYFPRLGAIVVRMPASDHGYVLATEHAIEHVDTRLADFCAAERFSATLRVADGNRPSHPADSLGFDGFPFFSVIFSDAVDQSFGGLSQLPVPYSLLVLALATLAGSVLVHRTVTHEMRLSQLRNDFVAAVSHEFRSPLSSILALMERLESARVRDPEQLADYHRIIGQDVRRLRTLVTRLLDFAQIEEGRKVYSPELVDLAEVTREAVRVCRQALPADRLALGDQRPAFCRADPEALQHCIQNLVENAAKYSAPDAPITIWCGPVDGHAVVSVQDRGIGIPPSEQTKIFEKFYRGRQASELGVQGVGIGLALVKHVVEHHGGSVLVDSEPGQGSRFELRLPRAEA